MGRQIFLIIIEKKPLIHVFKNVPLITSEVVYQKIHIPAMKYFLAIKSSLSMLVTFPAFQLSLFKNITWIRCFVLVRKKDKQTLSCNRESRSRS